MFFFLAARWHTGLGTPRKVIYPSQIKQKLLSPSIEVKSKQKLLSPLYTSKKPVKTH